MKLFFCFAISLLASNPVGLQIVSGSAQLSMPDSKRVEIEVSDQSILQWSDFSIDEGECTCFLQPSSRGVVLNRVVGSNESRIDGTLVSNGNVFLVNPAGILIGKNANFQCESLFLSAYPLADQAFLYRNNLKNREFGKQAPQTETDSSSCFGINESLNCVSSQGGKIIHRGVINSAKSVVLSGDEVEVFGSIFATKNGLGGEISVFSETTIIHPVALLSAQGKNVGGNIILKSEKYVSQYGDLLAEGGLIEISGKEGFHFGGNVCAGTIERPGRLLLDPTDIDIGFGMTTPPSFAYPPAQMVFDRPGPTAVLNSDELVSQLNNNVSVTIQTTPGAGGQGRIRVLAPLLWHQPSSLTFLADESIHLLADIECLNTGVFSFTAADEVLVQAYVNTRGDLQIAAHNFRVESNGPPAILNVSDGNLDVVLTGDLTIQGGLGVGADAFAKIHAETAAFIIPGTASITGGDSKSCFAELSTSVSGMIDLQIGQNLTMLGGDGIESPARIFGGAALTFDVGASVALTSGNGSEAHIFGKCGTLDLAVGTSIASNLTLQGTALGGASIIESAGNMMLSCTQEISANLGKICCNNGSLTISASGPLNFSSQSSLACFSNFQISSGSFSFDQSDLTISEGFSNLSSSAGFVFQNQSFLHLYSDSIFQGTTFSLNQSSLNGAGSLNLQISGAISFTNALIDDFPNGIINAASMSLDQSTLRFKNLTSSLSGNLVLQNGSELRTDENFIANLAGFSVSGSTLSSNDFAAAATAPTTFVNSLISVAGRMSLTGTSISLIGSYLQSTHSTLTMSYSGVGSLVNSKICGFGDFSGGFSNLGMDASLLQSTTSINLTGIVSLDNSSSLSAGNVLAVSGDTFSLSNSTILASHATLMIANGISLLMNAECVVPFLFSATAGTLFSLNLAGIETGLFSLSTPAIELIDSTINADQGFQIQAGSFSLMNSTISDPYSILQD